MQRVTIDVVIPAFNASSFISQAILSVRSQTYLPSRIIVVDDGSTDGTAEVVQRDFGNDPNITYVYKANKGLSSARNRGVAEASAEFIAFLDADDVWLPEKLGEQVKIFEASNDGRLGVVYCGCSYIDQRGMRIQDYPDFQIKPSVRGDVFSQLLYGNEISGSGSGVLVRKACLDAVGGFDENLPTCEDWDMWLRLAREYHFDYSEKRLVQIRRHSANMQGDANRMFRGYIGMFNKWVCEADRQPAVLRTWRKEYFLPMVIAVMRELPGTRLYNMLVGDMSPRVKKIAMSQIPGIIFDLGGALVRKTLH